MIGQMPKALVFYSFICVKTQFSLFRDFEHPIRHCSAFTLTLQISPTSIDFSTAKKLCDIHLKPVI